MIPFDDPDSTHQSLCSRHCKDCGQALEKLALGRQPIQHALKRDVASDAIFWTGSHPTIRVSVSVTLARLALLHPPNTQDQEPTLAAAS
jgi:hypothetical protein